MVSHRLLFEHAAVLVKEDMYIHVYIGMTRKKNGGQ